MQSDLALRHRDQLTIAAHGCSGFVGPALDRVRDTLGESPEWRKSGGREFSRQEVAIVAVAGVRSLVRDDNAFLGIIEEIDQCGGDHDLPGAAGQWATMANTAHPARRPSAQESLAERLARGEIDTDDYHQRLNALREPPPG